MQWFFARPLARRLKDLCICLGRPYQKVRFFQIRLMVPYFSEAHQSQKTDLEFDYFNDGNFNLLGRGYYNCCEFVVGNIAVIKSIECLAMFACRFYWLLQLLITDLD